MLVGLLSTIEDNDQESFSNVMLVSSVLCTFNLTYFAFFAIYLNCKKDGGRIQHFFMF